MGLELNLVNLMDVLQKVTDVNILSLHLGVPEYVMVEIRYNYGKTKDRKRAMLTWWLDNDLNCT